MARSYSAGEGRSGDATEKWLERSAKARVESDLIMSKMALDDAVSKVGLGRAEREIRGIYSELGGGSLLQMAKAIKEGRAKEVHEDFIESSLRQLDSILDKVDAAREKNTYGDLGISGSSETSVLDALKLVERKAEASIGNIEKATGYNRPYKLESSRAYDNSLKKNPEETWNVFCVDGRSVNVMDDEFRGAKLNKDAEMTRQDFNDFIQNIGAGNWDVKKSK